MPDPRRPLDIGDVIHGFANGVFGRDHYTCVKIVAVGPDWITCQGTDGMGRTFTCTASGRPDLELCQINRERLNDYGPDGGPCCDLATLPPLTTWKPS